VREVVKETKAANRDDLPVVFTNGVTVVEDGVVASHQSSGNNTTGLIPDDTAISVKKLEFLKQINPAAKRVGVFISPNPVSAKEKTLAALESEGQRLGLSVVRYEIPVDSATRTADAGARQVTGAIKHGDIDAIMTIPDPVITTPTINSILADLGKREKIPTMLLNIVDNGLLAYNLDLVASGKQAAVMVDKIFNGTAPKDIPIEFPEKNVLIIDLRTASDIGVTIPDSLIRIADQVIR
jgi:putative ABC transport system substrate-binding protein